MGNIIFIACILAGFFLVRVLSRKMQIPQSWLALVWTAKLVCSLIYVYIFTTYYGEGYRIQGDALHFMEDSRVLADLAASDPQKYVSVLLGFQADDPGLLNGPLAQTNIWDYGDNGDWINDNRLIIRLNSLVHFISFGNVYVHVTLFSMLSLLGLVLLYKAFANFVTARKLFFFAICLLPSIAFFGSGLTKETILIFSLGLLFWSVVKLVHEKFSLPVLISFLIAAMLCFFNKPYTGLVIVPLTLMLFAGSYFNWKKNLLWVGSLLILGSAIFLSYMPDKFNLVEKISYKQKDMTNLARGGVFFVTDSSFCAMDFSYFENFDTVGNNKIVVTAETPGEYKLFGEKIFHPFKIKPAATPYEIYLVAEPSSSYFETTAINYQGINLVKTIPECLLNTLVRPFPNDPGSILKFVTIFQNWALLIFTGLVFFRKKVLSAFERYWLFILLTASFILLLVIGWTTPVFGAIVRYKVPVDIFLLISLFILYKPLKPVKP
ncbi:MAG: hypothetical protein HYZ14_03660 [Bacteroidetes bacterium]|nr:hypothetical protein [Bacteroidota bacterium]